MFHIFKPIPSLDQMIDDSLWKQAHDPNYRKLIETEKRQRIKELNKLPVVCDRCGNVTTHGKTKRYCEDEDEDNEDWTGLMVCRKGCT